MDNTRTHQPYHKGSRDEDILVHFNDHADGHYTDTTTYSAVRRALTKRSSKSYSARVTREKSRKRDFLKSTRPGITVDTSFTRHKGNQPHEVLPHDDIHSGGSIRKQSWFSVGRSSTKNKGLGITKGTPQPGHSHRANPSVDTNDLQTAISLAPGTQPWQDLSPWDRRIPIGISVPTDSVSDFGSYKMPRHRSGSDATLVTPNIVITPAEAMKSVWSPDTPFTESDYTPSVSGRNPFSNQNTTTVPPVPALPAGVLDSSGINTTSKGMTGHSRNDTLDSAGTAFEEDDDVKRSHRIMSTGTVFEEDETPLRERAVDAPISIDTTLVPTPRRSQGWWNFITTPFVTTPNTAVFPTTGSQEQRAPAVPTMPTQYGQASEAQPNVPVTRSNVDNPTPESRDTAHPAPSNTSITQNMTVSHTTITQPQHAASAPVPTDPVIGTGPRGINAVMMPLQVEKEPRTININIELQDRRPPPLGAIGTQTIRANTPPTTQRSYTSGPTTQYTANSRTNSPAQNLPVFAPPPTYAVKGSHFSYDNGSRSSSPTYTKDPKGKKQNKEKKHRKVFDIMTCFPFIKNRLQKKQKNQVQQDGQQEKKKKRRGWCFWGCCCCLIFLIFLAILIPLVIVLTRRGNDKPSGTPPIGTQPDQSANSGWLNLPNYPPIPTGISTVAQPEAVTEQSGCVAPTTLWSCALPKEQQDSVKPNKPDQPNFRIQIMYDDSKKTTPTTKRAVNPVSAGAFIRSRLLKLRALPSPSPAPPSNTDMSFLGQTTDGNTAPFEGEDTPLFITFQDPKKSAARMVKRDANDPTNITAVIPPPMLDTDGTAAATNLLPLPVAQPLRLYNRGKDNEYYGFYTYFDRSIFMKQINGTNRGGNPADVDGGSPKAAANLRCTFSQTRFFVQIWTRSSKTKTLLQTSAQSGPDSSKRPGTFPYPVTITLDRHGGDVRKKNLYCYEMQSDGTIKNNDASKYFIFEDRGFGGNLVNGTQGRPNISGPIDGGTGGCRCQWQNWLG